jgi:Asp-tRNA(Asn)/Glu-tRNA(Gln) amidotransferase C subunit
MSTSDITQEQVRMLAGLVGVSIDAEDLPEVANRFASLIRELDRLRDMDLEGVEPVTIFPDTDGG